MRARACTWTTDENEEETGPPRQAHARKRRRARSHIHIHERARLLHAGHGVVAQAEQRRQQRKLGQRKELALDEVVRRREHEPKLPSVRIDRLLLDRTGGSERRAVTQYRPKSQRVLHVVKEPNLQAQEASESAGVSSMSNSSELRHARHQGHQAQVYRGMRVHTLNDRPL